MIKLFDFDSSPGSDCWSLNCAILPVGYGLLVVDSYFDLNWVLSPSPATKRALIRYYTTILTPQLRYGFPGFWWPVFVICRLCIQCPTKYNYWLLAIFVAISYRYKRILNGTDTQLNHWWTIVICRILLAVINTWNLQTLQCYEGTPSLGAYAQHIRNAVAW
ncbi:expressed unknown protein [Seminavis robusta]|uniref:Uncharacterized protein n=1 Tax=Seminavis robusta TaxID=568900 RepID=A0A9N8EYZ7_9STRA|nr:expressed unknown protein [Seminavis robusta]|eukprot:Sro2249_g320740.1 n/a (162) ;mRNA; r:8204-8689